MTTGMAVLVGARTEQGSGQRSDQNPLAYTCRTRDEQGVRNTSSLAGPGDGLPAALVPGQKFLVVGPRIHSAATFEEGRDQISNLLGYLLRGNAGVDQAHPLRLRPGNGQIPGTDGLEEFPGLGLEAIRCGSLACTRKTGGHRQIEKQGQVGTHGALDVVLEKGDAPRVDTAAAALIGIGGIRETVAEHPGSLLQGWPNLVRDVLCTRGEHEKKLGIDRHPFTGSIEQQRPDTLADDRSTRLPGGQYIDAPVLQAAPDDSELSRFARTLDALQCDEATLSLHLCEN